MRLTALLVLAALAMLTKPATAGGFSFNVSFGSGWAPRSVVRAPVIAPAPVVCSPVVVRQPVVCAPVACAPVVVPVRSACAPVVAAPVVVERGGWRGQRDRRADHSQGYGHRHGRGHSH